MRDTPRPGPTGDLDTPDDIAEMVRRLTLFNETIDLGWTGPEARRARDLADNVARGHSHQPLGDAVSLGSGAST